MDRLPAEHIIAIFLLLDKAERIRLTLVCKRWYTLIRDHCLYQELKITNIDRLEKAIQSIAINPHLGELVKTLIVNDCQIDCFILLLPKYFPNLRLLEWTEEDKSWEDRQLKRRSITSIPSSQIWQREFGKWKKIESIRVTLEKLPFVTLILKSSKLINLTKLSISFQRLHLDQIYGAATMKRLTPVVEEVVKHLEYVPFLKYLHFEKPVLRLKDMDNIHWNLPNLQELQLNFVCMSLECTSRSGWTKVNKFPATSVKKIDFTFYINSSSTLHTIQRSQKAMTNWLTYISSKYTKLEDMVLELSNYDGVPIINDFEKPIIKIIRNTSALSYYSGQIYPITDTIMKTIDESQGKIKEIYMFADKIEEMEVQLDYICASAQAKTLNELTIYAWDLDIHHHTFSPYRVVISLLSLNFFNLAHLNLDFLVHYNTIVHILKELSLLETLTLHSIKIDEDELIQVMPVNKCNIKCLDIELICDNKLNMDRVNLVLLFLMQSCPILEEFRIKGDFSDRNFGILRIYFVHHDRLKEVYVDVKGTQYYSFSWEIEKQGIAWRNYNDPLGYDVNTENMFHIDIVWSNIKPKFILEMAPVP